MSTQAVDAIVSVLRGTHVPYPADMASRDLIETCVGHEVVGLMAERLVGRNDWPVEIREELTRRASGDAAIELLRRRELARVLESLGSCGVEPILIKGAALAYTIYGGPHCRPRMDTDFLIRREHVDAVRDVMARLGYTASLLCDGEALFNQFEMSRCDEFGVEHACDFHWKISTQPVFADVMSYDELRQRAMHIPVLGPRAVAAGHVDALLLASIHPVMHHRNATRTLWMYDIHLLASKLPEADLLVFAELALEKRVARICAEALRSSQALFHTWLPDSVVRCLDTAGAEASADYLSPNRRWHDELLSSLRGLPSMGHRVRLLREVLFPNPAYMFEAYRLSPTRLGPLLLPALYLHRNLHGAWKICSGRK